jgi:hypothetical protein
LQICLEDAEQNRAKNDASTIYRYTSWIEFIRWR